MKQSPREHPRPWAVQETGQAFRVMDAENNLLAEIPFATGLGRGLNRDAARQMADRMLEAGEALGQKQAPSCGEETG